MEKIVQPIGTNDGHVRADAVDVKSRPTAHKVVESIVGAVDWVTDTEGYCECPGKSSHTTPDGRKDCMVYLDQVPTLSCFHSNCQELRNSTNQQLRRALADGLIGNKGRRLTEEDRRRIREREKKESIRRRASNSRTRILKDYRWPSEQIIQDSPISVVGKEAEHWRLLLKLFRAGDVVWTGNKFHSGKPEHQAHFLSVDEWLKQIKAPAQFTCPAVFKPGCFARTNDNILARRFLVVESDTLSRDEVGAIFKWMKDKVRLNLRAVVDTAGKSLHAWFDYPAEAVVEELRLVLPELGCDPKLFTASQPVRLPGALRDGKYQKLVYLARVVVS